MFEINHLSLFLLLKNKGKSETVSGYYGGYGGPLPPGNAGPTAHRHGVCSEAVLPLYIDLSAVSVPEKQQLLPTEGTSGNICT